MTIFLTILHVLVSSILMLVVLLQQGRGGGVGAAFGGTTSQVFGGGGAGNFLTRATGIAATLFMLTSVSLAWMSSTGDRDMKARIAAEALKSNERGTMRPKQKPAPSATQSPSGAAPQDTAPQDTRGVPSGPDHAPGVPSGPDQAPTR